MIKYIVFCPLGYSEKATAFGDTPRIALDELIKEYGDELNLKEAVFYEARECKLRVDTSPVIFSTN
jgi:hypothetical protein